MATTTVFHGTANTNIKKFLQKRSRQTSYRMDKILFVTDTPERAARYANAQATGMVKVDVFELGVGAAIIELETSEEIKWYRRSENHSSLDQCEATIETFEIVSITINPDPYWNSKTNRVEIPALIAEFGDKIKLVSPLPVAPNKNN